MKNLPACFFPTMVVCLDDDTEILNSFAVNFPLERAHYKFFSQPKEMLSFINDEYKADPFVNRCIDRPETFNPEQSNVDISIRDIYKEAYNTNRFNQVSVIVLDYDMPGMNGLEVCREISDPYVQKILLTGAADEYLAVEAFNEGLIHKFIRKQDKNVSQLIEDAIAEGQVQYFNRLSKVVRDAVVNNPDEPSAFADPNFAATFSQFVKDNNIAEFYLFETSGSFITLSADAQATGFFVKSKDQMSAIALEAKDDEFISEDTQKAVQALEKIFCYQFAKDEGFPDPKDWEQYFADAKKVDNLEPFFYGISTNLAKLDPSKIQSFNAFKDENYSK